jgi:hypothetical protein
VADQPVWVSISVDAFVMMTDDSSNLRVVVDVLEYPLANYRMLLHLSALFESQRAWLLEQTRWEPHLPNVMNEAADMRKFLLCGA